MHALSFDIEDWFHLVEIDAVRDPADWPRLSGESSIVERYADLILRVCAEHQTRATFFVLGWVAERHPALDSPDRGGGARDRHALVLAPEGLRPDPGRVRRRPARVA